MNLQDKNCFGGIWGLIFILSFLTADASFSQESTWDSIHDEAHYFIEMDSADEATFRREFEYPFLLLLNENQKEIYKNINALIERKTFIERFWKARNPNPILPENDWLMVYINRCIYAKKHYSSSEPPYLDDRGKYYIKYGKPSHWHKDVGGSRSVRFFRDRAVYQFLSHLYSGFPPNKYYEVYPNESWIYRNLGQDFVIYFVKIGAVFEEENSLIKALSTGLSKNKAWYWNDLIRDRAHLSPSLTSAANNLLQIENEIYTSVHLGQMVGMDKTNIVTPHTRILEQRYIHEAEIFMYRKDSPVSTYDPVNAVDELKFFNDIAQFRGSHDSTKVEILFLSPLKNNVFRSRSLSMQDPIGVEFQCLVRDSIYTPIVQMKDTPAFLMNSYELAGLPNAFGTLAFLAYPQKGDLTLQVKEMKEGRIGFSRQPFVIRDFRGNELMISDIQFFTKVTDTNQLQILPVLEKQTITVAPYPYREIRKSIPVFCYFEIYNIIAAGITTEYEITLKVTTDESRGGLFRGISKMITGKKEHSISLSHTRSVIGENAEELVAVDFSNLANGGFLFAITVTEPTNETITATIQKKVMVIN